MVDVDGMTDAELRTKLTEFGFPMMPITGTTRKIMVKKLKLLLENKNDGRRSLGRYSSEEESDGERERVVRKNRRATIAAAPTPSQRKPMRREPEPITTTSSSSTTTTTKRTVAKSTSDDFDTGSDSEPEPIARPPFHKKDASFASPSERFSPMTTSSPRFVTNDAALDRLNQIRSRLSLGDRPIVTTSNEDHRVETPFLSNFTQRLSQMSAGNSRRLDYDYKNDVIKEHDTNGSGYATRPYVGRTPRYASQPYYNRGPLVKQNNAVPLILVGVACLFFVAVAIMYYGMRSDTNALEKAGYFVPHCGTMSDPNPGVNCIHESSIEGAVQLMRFLKPELVQRSIGHACHDVATKPFLTESEALKLHHVATDQSMQVAQRRLQDMEVLVFSNPEWGISLVKTDGGNDLTEDLVLENMPAVLAYKSKALVGLVVLNPDLPWHCRFYNKLYAVFNTVIVLVALACALYVGNYAYKRWKSHRRRRKDEVYDMVRRIVDVLESSAGGDDFLVINHVRDMILPLKNRSQMAKVWDDAVRFINENESRVRTEVQVVQGEPYEVWRWLGAGGGSNSSYRSKSWQGQAFETQVGSVNSLPCSPTPCLKVRGMMDDNDRNLHSIREAVLGKCAGRCRILHCAIDSSTKCVYLKCADQNDAAVAYRNLHGWWYSGHLVTVKYLRLERYMQRFPDSPTVGPPYLKSPTMVNDWTN